MRLFSNHNISEYEEVYFNVDPSSLNIIPNVKTVKTVKKVFDKLFGQIGKISRIQIDDPIKSYVQFQRLIQFLRISKHDFLKGLEVFKLMFKLSKNPTLQEQIGLANYNLPDVFKDPNFPDTRLADRLAKPMYRE